MWKNKLHAPAREERRHRLLRKTGVAGLDCNDKRALSVRWQHSVAERNLWWGVLFTSQGLLAVSDEKRLPDTHRKK